MKKIILTIGMLIALTIGANADYLARTNMVLIGRVTDVDYDGAIIGFDNASFSISGEQYMRETNGGNFDFSVLDFLEQQFARTK